MTKGSPHLAGSTFTFRVDPDLKAEFMSAVEVEKQPVAQVLRAFMSAYVARQKRKEFEAEARRQSSLIASSPEEKDVMDWIRGVADTGEWK